MSRPTDQYSRTSVFAARAARNRVARTYVFSSDKVRRTRLTLVRCLTRAMVHSLSRYPRNLVKSGRSLR